MITKSLVPFVKIEAPTIDLSVKVDRQGDFLILRYVMTGAIESILMAEPEVPVRRMRLWETTCLECFFGVPGQDLYWEINLSTAGHWNVFRLDNYRSGFREELSIQALSILIDRSVFSLVSRIFRALDLRFLKPLHRAVRFLSSEPPRIIHDTNVFSLETELDLSLLGIQDSEIELSVTAVIADKWGAMSYWAVCHGGIEADFHLRNSFVIRI